MGAELLPRLLNPACDPRGFETGRELHRTSNEKWGGYTLLAPISTQPKDGATKKGVYNPAT